MIQSGIYIIINHKNFKVYIGQTKNFDKRVIRHKRRFVQKEHKSYSKLYPAINKHGIENFEFIFLEECNPDIMNKREKEWIKELDSFNNGYNATIGGSNPISYWNGKKRSKETNDKISKTLTGKKLSEETKRKIGQSNIGKHKPHGKPAWNKGLKMKERKQNVNN